MLSRAMAIKIPVTQCTLESHEIGGPRGRPELIELPLWQRDKTSHTGQRLVLCRFAETLPQILLFRPARWPASKLSIETFPPEVKYIGHFCQTWFDYAGSLTCAKLPLAPWLLHSSTLYSVSKESASFRKTSFAFPMEKLAFLWPRHLYFWNKSTISLYSGTGLCAENMHLMDLNA